MRFSIWPATHTHTHTCTYSRPVATKVVGVSHIDINFKNWPNSGWQQELKTGQLSWGGVGARSGTGGREGEHIALRTPLTLPSKRVCDTITSKISGDDPLRSDPIETDAKRSRAEQPNNIKLIANMINCTLTWSFIANYMQNMPRCQLLQFALHRHGKLASRSLAWGSFRTPNKRLLQRRAECNGP